MFYFSRLIFFYIFLYIATPPFFAQATKTEIVFGQSAVFSGPSKALGLGLRDGLLAAFNEVNQKGGVYNKKLRLISKDDGYEPTKTIANIRSLLAKDKVFSLVGGVGTASSKAIFPVLVKKKLLYIGPLTGASIFRQPKFDLVINVRASYKQEIKAMLIYLEKKLKVKRIAVFFQNDSYGQDGLNSAKEIISQSKTLKLVSQGSYVRNTSAIKTALLNISKGRPEAVIMIGLYLPSSLFIKWAEKIHLKASFWSVSPVVISALAKEIKGIKSKVFVTQVVPFPFDTKNKLSKQYNKAMDQIKNKHKGFISFEGYIVGRLIIEVLKKLKTNLNYKNFFNIFQNKKLYFSATELSLINKKTNSVKPVFLTQIRKGVIVPVEQ